MSPGAPALASPRASDPAARPPLRVLLVDDDPLVLDLLRDVMTGEGWVVSVTTTAEEGLELVAGDAFDLVVTDIRLPALSGLDLLRAVKERRPVTPVVLITGVPSVNSAVFALRNGAFDYLRKPFSMDEVRQVLRGVAAARRGAGAGPDAAGRRAEEQGRQQLGVEALFRIGELGLQGLESTPYLDTALGFVVQGVRSEAAVVLLRDEGATLSRRATGEPGLVQQIVQLAEGAVAPLASTAGADPLCLTGSRDAVAVVAAGVPEPGGGLTILAVGRSARHGAFLPGEQELILRYAQAIALALRRREDGGADVFIDTISFLTTMLESKDASLKGHSARVSLYAGELAAAAGLARQDVAVVRRAGLLHDLGKLMVLDAILLKPGPLTPEELAVVRRHPAVGGRILRRLRHFEQEAETVEHHLERWDGTGHPGGRRGEEIGLPARIVAIADAFDAMTSPRPYRAALTVEAALTELVREAGRQFDPRLVQAFVTLPAARLREISRYYRAPAGSAPEPAAGPPGDGTTPAYLVVARGHEDLLAELRSVVREGLDWVRLIEDRRDGGTLLPRGDGPDGPSRLDPDVEA